VSGEPTTLNLITYCKVTEASPGKLLLEGDGFTLALKYNQNSLKPAIEFNEVTDEGLRRYWPDGITRIVFEIQNQAAKGKNQLVIEPVK